MSNARTSKKKTEEATFRASEEVKQIAEEDKEVKSNAIDEAGDKAPEEANKVADASTYFCTNCGKGLDAESNFCPKCGVRTENGVKAGVAIPWASDPHVRQELDVALQRASKAVDDGVKIVRETFREVAGEVERGVKQARVSVPVMCQSCGQENLRFAKFCGRCGKEL